MSVKFVQLHQYSSPRVTENNREDWVSYGDSDNFYQYLIDLYHSSPTNNAAIKGIADLIYGGGLEVVKADRHLDGYLHLRKLFRPDCVRKIVMDYKMLGEASFQLIKSKDGKKYVQAEHFPRHTLRPEKCNEKGEIEAYYYHHDWSQIKPSEQPERIPAFGYEGKSPICIYVIKPYSTGNKYINPVDYQGGLQYAELESEIANYHLNNIKNGLQPTMIVNFNNGIPPERKQQQIERKLVEKFGGSSNAGKFILAFNDDKESGATIEPVQLSDAHNQYQFLSTECMTKIMVAHRVTSPMLLGIKDQTGLGNNADELKTASILFDNTVIRPFQNAIIEAIQDVLHFNGYSLDLYFKTLQPLEFTDLSGKRVDSETAEKETGVELSADCPQGYNCNEEGDIDLKAPCWKGYEQIGYKEKNGKRVPNCVPIKNATELDEDDAKATAFQDMSDDDESMWLDLLEQVGETMDLDEWELVDEEEVTDPSSEDEKYKFFKRFANPQDKSSDDSGLYKIRYRYSQSIKDTSRTFCKNMVANSKQGVVYRREDIDNMAGKVNTEFSPKGSSSYSIWMHKGGAYCHHYWVRQVYMRKRQNGKFAPKSKTKELENEKRVAESKAKSAGVPSGKFKPKNWKDAKTRPIDRPDRGKLN